MALAALLSWEPTGGIWQKAVWSRADQKAGASFGQKPIATTSVDPGSLFHQKEKGDLRWKGRGDMSRWLNMFVLERDT